MWEAAQAGFPRTKKKRMGFKKFCVIDSQAASVFGLRAVQASKSIRADAAFLGISGVRSRRAHASSLLRKQKSKGEASSKQQVVLADHSKLYSNARWLNKQNCKVFA